MELAKLVLLNLCVDLKLLPVRFAHFGVSNNFGFLNCGDSFRSYHEVQINK